MPKRKPRNLRGRFDDSYIIKHEAIPYGIKNNSRYKHIDELTLYDGKVVKATLGPMDMSVFPFGGTQPYTVPQHMENRIDLISLKFYGISSLYWVICYMNHIDDPLVIPAGRVLFIPSLSGIRKFPNPLS
jgi:hypothetical protein